MNSQIFSDAMGEINDKYIETALTYQCPVKRKGICLWFKRGIAACLVLGLCFGAFLTTNEAASAAFFGWLKEVYELFSVYRSPNNGDASLEAKEYRLGWIPDGYSDVSVREANGTVLICYTNKENQRIAFIYINDSNSTNLFVDTANVTKHEAEVNGCSADLYISDTPDVSNTIVWINEHNTAMSISAFLDEDELIRLAESVTETERLNMTQ